MQNKNKQNKNRNSNKNSKKKRTPQSNHVPSLGPLIKSAVAAGLRSSGSAVGGYFGGPAGAVMGREAGAYISKIVGSGDYMIDQNTVLAGRVPQFQSEKHAIRIAHREYLGDVSGSILFTNTSYAIQPGNSATFPWLSSIVNNFQQYLFKGLVFEFKSTSAVALNSTNTALGTVIMGTEYNVSNPNFINKMQAENFEFSTSCPPCDTMIHPVECSMKEQPYNMFYVRDQAVPSGQDAKLYDLGNFQLMTVGMQAAAVIGELWVSYDIELYKPRLLTSNFVGGFTQVYNSAYSNANPLGTSLWVTNVNDIPYTISGTVLTLSPAVQSGIYFINISWVGTSVAYTLTNPTLANCTSYLAFSNGAGGSVITNSTGSVCSYVGAIRVTGYSATGTTLTFAGLTLPTTGTQVNILIAGVADPLSV